MLPLQHLCLLHWHLSSSPSLPAEGLPWSREGRMARGRAVGLGSRCMDWKGQARGLGGGRQPTHTKALFSSPFPPGHPCPVGLLGLAGLSSAWSPLLPWWPSQARHPATPTRHCHTSCRIPASPTVPFPPHAVASRPPRTPDSSLGPPAHLVLGPSFRAVLSLVWLQHGWTLCPGRPLHPEAYGAAGEGQGSEAGERVQEQEPGCGALRVYCC